MDNIFFVRRGDLIVLPREREFQPGSLRAFWWKCLLRSKNRAEYYDLAGCVSGTDDDCQSFLAWLIRTKQVYEV